MLFMWENFKMQELRVYSDTEIYNLSMVEHYTIMSKLRNNWGGKL